MVRGYLTKIVIMASCAFSIWGCAATRYIANPTPPPADLALAARSEELEVKLHHVIVPDGPGSWVQGAKWNEWMVSVRNLTEADLQIMTISVIDPRGAYVHARYGISPLELEQETERIVQTYGQTAAMMVAGPAIGQAVGQAVLATGSFVPYYGANLLIMGIGPMQAYMQAKDREAIGAEFGKRRLPLPLELSGSGNIKGSVFLPLVPQPRALVITYRKSRVEFESERQLKLSFEKILTPPHETLTAQQP